MENINSTENDNVNPNIFVTQINERESDGHTRNYIVKENADTLLRTGLNTFQDTLVVRKEREMSNVDVELFQKRQNNEKVMSKFMKKRQELMAKQQAFLDKMKTFESFIKENEAKRRRALVKYQSEVRLLEQQKRITHELDQDISNIKTWHEKLLKKVQFNKRYEDFLLKVIDSMPQDYIKVTENILGGLIMRYNTLYSNNEDLLAKMENKSEEGNICATAIAKLKEGHDNIIFQSNCRISMMYEEHERLKDHIERAEQNFRLKHADVRTEILHIGLTLRSIDNITNKCSRKFDHPILDSDLNGKIDKIQEYIMTSRQIIETVQQMKDERPALQLPQITNNVSLTVAVEGRNQNVSKTRTSSSRSK